MGCRIDDPGASRRSASDAWLPDFGERETWYRVDAVASVPGEGTTFTIYLPRVGAPPSAPVVDEAAEQVDGRGLRLLVVEDNVEVGAFAVQTLGELGFTTVLAANGTAALARLAEDANRFDIVFSDVMMPGMNGIELAQEIRRLHRDLPVVLTSGYSHVLAQNGTCGFDLLHKPYSVEQLSRVLRKAASQRRPKRPIRRQLCPAGIGAVTLALDMPGMPGVGAGRDALPASARTARARFVGG